MHALVEKCYFLEPLINGRESGFRKIYIAEVNGLVTYLSQPLWLK